MQNWRDYNTGGDFVKVCESAITLALLIFDECAIIMPRKDASWHRRPH